MSNLVLRFIKIYTYFILKIPNDKYQIIKKYQIPMFKKAKKKGAKTIYRLILF